MRLPIPRGPMSSMLVEHLSVEPHPIPTPPEIEDLGTDVLLDDDLQLALFICYELHYGGFTAVDGRWEWQPSVLALRAALEERFERALAKLAGLDAAPAWRVPARLFAMAAEQGGPSLSHHIESHCTVGQFREFVVHRSVYHLREADPHTWAIPRIAGRAKAALVEIQADEYGGGHLERMHAELFRTTMRWLGLDASYGTYLDTIPAVTLATNNVMSLFGLHRRHRGAVLGHLAALEMTSSLANRRYAAGLRRLGGGSEAAYFYDEHVEADAAHEQIAAQMCRSFCATQPDEATEVVLGAACCLALDRAFAGHLLTSWTRGDSSLRPSWTESAAGLPHAGAAVPACGVPGDRLVGAIAERLDPRPATSA